MLKIYYNICCGIDVHKKLLVATITILSEIGADMSAFKDAEHLCSWAGLTPQCNESAGKKKSVHVSRAGIYLKPLLIQCANNAIRDKNCEYFKLRYEAIKTSSFIDFISIP